MSRRIAAIWFPHLLTDRMLRRQPDLRDVPFALADTERGRRVVKAVNSIAHAKGVYNEMVVADCKAIAPDLQVFDFAEEELHKLLNAIAEWCIRYTPLVTIDPPDGLLLDASGCTHLWGGENEYLADIENKFSRLGYHTRTALADTAGAAWALAHYGRSGTVALSGTENKILSALPPAALKLDADTVSKLEKLGLKTIGSFISMPRAALRRRFGASLIMRIGQALGEEMEITDPIRPVSPYIERLPSLDPIRTAAGIEVALKSLLEMLCKRLNQESKGLRKCEFRCYRIDGQVEKIEIGTGKPTRNETHLFRLFEIKIPQIRPALGIELFMLEAPVVEELLNSQDALWAVPGADEAAVAELLDRLAGKAGATAIHRYLPAEHYWPERSVKEALSLSEKPEISWQNGLPRPLHLLQKPETIEVSVPVPDYPPLLFRYKNQLHTVVKADGPERIEQEWWIQSGQYRDYYCVEDQHGARYWLFRSGDYYSGNPEWFIHGFFA